MTTMTMTTDKGADMRKHLFALLVLAACTEAGAVSRIRGVEFWQDADSARFVVLWTAAPPPTARQAPFSHYEVQMVTPPTVPPTVPEPLPVASDTTSFLNDTLAVPYPALGTTIELMARVRSVDVGGRVSDWANSTPPHITLSPLPILPPSPPGGVTTDTLTVASVHLRPWMVVMAPGAQFQFCTIVVLSDGTSGLASNSPLFECQPIYERWLLEVPV